MTPRTKTRRSHDPSRAAAGGSAGGFVWTWRPSSLTKELPISFGSDLKKYKICGLNNFVATVVGG